MKNILFNPFEKYSDNILISLGLLFSAAGILLGYSFNARYDGILDLHFVEKVKIIQLIFEVFVNIFCASILLFAFGKFINNKTRFIDIVTVFMIARAPLYLLTLSNLNGIMFKISSEIIKNINPTTISNSNVSSLISDDLPILLVFSMIMILFIIWFFTLLWNRFKVATNAKGNKAVYFFITAVILAEIASKIIINLVNL